MNVTVGKYIPGNSFVHRLDPRVKLSINIVFIVLVFMTKNFIMEAMLLTPLILSYLAAGLKKRQIFRMMLPVVFIGVFLFGVNLFVITQETNPGIKIYGGWWKLTLSDLAIQRTLLIMTRIYIMIITTTLLTATTRPMALTRAIENLLMPLKLIFVPVHIIAMIISIALRFIPTLLEEAQRIMKAQASRGVDFKNGNLKSKSKSMVTLIIPLFVSAFGKADDLSNAMETRGYDPYEKRTRYRAYPIKPLDIIVSLFIIGIITIVALQLRDIIHVPYWIKG